MLNLCLINNSKGFYTPQNKTFKSWLHFLKSNENFEINIVLENKDKMREYNRKYRNKKKFTDVLSFPYDGHQPKGILILGDIIMCPEAIYDKANKYSFSIKNCWAHMTIHSTLHLLGYKHDEDHDRFLMEKKEIELLGQLGVQNPYFYNVS